MSPPTGVQASPVATPGTLVRMAISLSKRGWPRIVAISFVVSTTRLVLPSAICDGDVAERLADLALQIANCRPPLYIP